MFELYYINGDHEELFGKYHTKELMVMAIDNYLHSINFKSYYWRMWTHEGKTWIDYGSHTRFFYYKEVGKTDKNG